MWKRKEEIFAQDISDEESCQDAEKPTYELPEAEKPRPFTNRYGFSHNVVKWNGGDTHGGAGYKIQHKKA